MLRGIIWSMVLIFTMILGLWMTFNRIDTWSKLGQAILKLFKRAD